MFDIAIIDSDLFLDMPSSSQALYFHLGMRADDEGFINNTRKIMKITGSGEDDLKILISKKFIIPFASGVLVIRHWKANNYLNNARIKKTLCVEEKAQLMLSENSEYELISADVKPMLNRCLTDVKPEEKRIEENSIEEYRRESTHAHVKNSLGDFLSVVKIEKKDLAKLITKHGEENVLKVLEKIDNYCLSTGKRYKSYFHRALNWLDEDVKKEVASVKKSRTEIAPDLTMTEPTEKEMQEYEKAVAEMQLEKKL